MHLRDLAASLVAVLVLACAPPLPPPVNLSELPGIVPGRAALQGIVYDVTTGLYIAGALIILHSPALGLRETETDARGIYSFTDLPPGRYTIQVLFKKAIVSRSFDLSPTQRFIARFGIAPNEKVVIMTD